MQMAYQTLTLYHKEANAIICTSCTWFPDDLPQLGKSWQLKYGGKMKALSRFHSQRKAEGEKHSSRKLPELPIPSSALPHLTLRF